MRRGMTLIETSALITIAGIILGGGVGVIRSLHRLASADTAAGTRAEQACALLRRDLAAGTAGVDGRSLRIVRGDGRATVWSRDGGSLLRDGRILAGVSAFAPAIVDGRACIDLTPAGLPPRRIEDWR